MAPVAWPVALAQPSDAELLKRDNFLFRPGAGGRIRKFQRLHTVLNGDRDRSALRTAPKNCAISVA